MQTECTPKLLEFEAVERRSVVAGFDGGNITSNAGALLLGQVDRGLGLVRRFADCLNHNQLPYADSDEAARVYRTYSAHRSNLMPPTNPI